MPTLSPSQSTAMARSAAAMLQALVESLARADRLGPGVRSESNNIRLMAEAAFAIPFDQLENAAVAIVDRQNPANAINTNDLRDASYPLFDALPASASSGPVHFSYKSPLPTSPAVLWAAGEIDFSDAARHRYRLMEDILLPTALFDSDESGTASETIGGVNTRISQRFPGSATEDEFPQAVRFTPTVLSGSPVATIRIETDSAGVASGILADPRLTMDFDIEDGVVNEAVFARIGRLREDRDYHAVIEVSGGTVSFDGGGGGGAGRVKFWNGSSWLTSATVENLNLEVVRGGVAHVQAVELGSHGNIAAQSIVAVRFSNSVAETRWNNLVGAYPQFENLDPFTGGQNVESVSEMERRIKRAKAARETGALGGIITYFLNRNVPGVTSIDGIENDTDEWGVEDKHLDHSSATGTSTEAIDATTTRIAFGLPLSEDGSFTQFALHFLTNNGFVFTARIETDAAGAPSGTLAHANLSESFSPVGTGRKVFKFTKGALKQGGDYWLVVDRTAGDATFDGDTGGAAGDVKVYSGGAWSDAAAVTRLRAEVYGGLPPGSARFYVEGGRVNDIAQALHIHKPIGSRLDGSTFGYATDIRGVKVERRFSRSIKDPVVIRIDVQATSDFLGGADTIRDLVVEYVGGNKPDNSTVVGLGVSEKLDYDELKARLIHGDPRTEGLKVTTLLMGTKSAFSTPSLLTSAEDGDLTPIQGHRFTIDVPATDILVSITPV